jgi:hypothetical protein
MNPIRKAITWLLTKEETTKMTDQVVEVPAVAATVVEPTTAAVVAEQASPSEADILLSKVKELLVKLGHNVEPVFDEVVALAKKLV